MSENFGSTHSDADNAGDVEEVASLFTWRRSRWIYFQWIGRKKKKKHDGQDCQLILSKKAGTTKEHLSSTLLKLLGLVHPLNYHLWRVIWILLVNILNWTLMIAPLWKSSTKQLFFIIQGWNVRETSNRAARKIAGFYCESKWTYE